MKMRFTIGAIFLSIYLVFVIAATPANFALSYVPLPQSISLNGVKGTIWNMSIDELVHPKVTVSTIEANLSFWSLFTLDPTISLEFGDTFSHGPSGNLVVSGLLADITIQNADLLMSANTIAQQMPLPLPISAGGDVKVSIEEFVVGKPVCQQVQGSIHWPNAVVSALNETLTLGSLAANLSCEQGALAVIIDEKNELGLSFTAYVRATRVGGNGYLTPGIDFPEVLKIALPFLGKADNQGRYRLGF